MEIKTQLQALDNKSEVFIIEVSGELALDNVNKLRKIVKEHISPDNKNILINLADVTHIDSSGIGVLVSSLAYLKKHHGKLKLTGIKGNVQRVFEFSKLDTAFSICKDKDEALASWD